MRAASRHHWEGSTAPASAPRRKSSTTPVPQPSRVWTPSAIASHHLPDAGQYKTEAEDTQRGRPNPLRLYQHLSDVLRIERRPADNSRFYSMHLAYQVLHHVLKLLLAFDDVAHAAQLWLLVLLLQQNHRMRLRHMIKVQTLGSFRLNAYV